MRYWKGLLIAAVFDVALIAGPGVLGTDAPLPARSQAIAWPHFVEQVGEPVEPQLPTLGELDEISLQIDSLMTQLQFTPEDPQVLLSLAHLYTSHGWWEDAIGPLARALTLDPENAELFKQVTVAVKRSGRLPATAVELKQWAEEFRELASMWGEHC